MMGASSILRFDATITRLGVVLTPQGESEAEGILNPASARDRDGHFVLYPRCVGQGNISRVGVVRAIEHSEEQLFERSGFALEPSADYEIRPALSGGMGCEDPRVTFVPVLGSYVMAYTAFGPRGPRVALALSTDAYHWERLGLVDFSGVGMADGDDKDAAFFPEPVRSPAGVESLAFYHRPMLRLSTLNGRAA